MRPRRGHGLRDLGRVQIGKDLLDPTQLGDGVDSMSSERLDQLILVILYCAPLAVIAPTVLECAETP